MIVEDYIKKFDILVYGKSNGDFKSHDLLIEDSTQIYIVSSQGEKIYIRFCGTTPEMTSEFQKFLVDFKKTTSEELCQSYQIDYKKYEQTITFPFIDAINKVMINFIKKEVSEIPIEIIKTVVKAIFYYYCWLRSKGYMQNDQFPEIYSDLGIESVSN